jgi:hypothetical protein
MVGRATGSWPPPISTANIKTPDKADFADLIGTINSSVRNHDGWGVQRTNEGSPARWALAP